MKRLTKLWLNTQLEQYTQAQTNIYHYVEQENRHRKEVWTQLGTANQSILFVK